MANQLNEFSSLVDFMQGVQAEDLAKDAVGLPMGNLSGFFSRGGLLGLLNNPDVAGPQNIQEQLRQQINGTPQEEQFVPGQIIEENVGEFNTAEEEAKRFGTPPPQLLPGIQDFLIKQSQTATGGNRPAISDSKKKQLSRLIEIQRIDPKMAALTMKIIQSGQDQEIKAAQREIEAALRESNALLRLPDEMLNSGIADIVKERARRGLASPRLIKAAQESDLETKRELLKLRRDLGTKTSDMFKLRQEEIKAKSAERLERLKSELKRQEEEVKPKPGFTLSQGQRRFDAQGRPIAEVPTEDKSLSSIAKLNADFNAGRITKTQRDLGIKKATEGRALVNISAFEKESEKLGARSDATVRDEVRGNARTASRSLAKVRNLSKLLKEASAGAFTQFFPQLGRIIPGFDATNEQAAQAQVNAFVLDQMKAFKGSTSDKELQFAETTVARLGNTREANEIILRSFENLIFLSQQENKQFDEFLKGGGGGRDFIFDFQKVLFPEHPKFGNVTLDDIQTTAFENGITMEEAIQELRRR